MVSGNPEDDSGGGNRSVLANGVRVLSRIATALEALAGLTIGVSTVAALPAVGTVAQGTRRTVTDANSTTFHAVAAGGGANVVPVYSDGSAWRIG